MAAASTLPRNLRIFDGEGYDYWCVKIDTILKFQESPKNVSEEQKHAYKESKRLDCKARVLLH